MENLAVQVEPFRPFLEEVAPLLVDHYEEISLHKGRFPLNPQYDEYLKRDAYGGVVTITLRKGEKLVGYIVAFVAPGLHYRDCLTLTVDIFYVAAKHRGRHGGVKLFRALEEEAKRRGVSMIVAGTKMHKDVAYLFQRLDYEPIETYYSKWID